LFTGIITNIATIEAVRKNKNSDLLLEISLPTKSFKRPLDLGCSIACNGICLTLVTKKNLKEKTLLSFQASKETCDKTTISNWLKGQKINLEFALRVGDELGGHMVLGHVDDVIEITAIKKIKESHQFTFLAPQKLIKFISKKGSVTLDGTSLTVNEVKKNFFSVNIISHTLENTVFGSYKIGDSLNIEIDAMARYVAQILKKND